MTSTLLFRRALLPLALVALTFVSCKQDEGETCRENDDCSTGRCCNVLSRADDTVGTVARGMCLAVSVCPATPLDMNVAADTGVADMSVDAAGDMAEPDMSAADLGQDSAMDMRSMDMTSDMTNADMSRADMSEDMDSVDMEAADLSDGADQGVDLGS